MTAYSMSRAAGCGQRRGQREPQAQGQRGGAGEAHDQKLQTARTEMVRPSCGMTPWTCSSEPGSCPFGVEEVAEAQRQVEVTPDPGHVHVEVHEGRAPRTVAKQGQPRGEVLQRQPAGEAAPEGKEGVELDEVAGRVGDLASRRRVLRVLIAVGRPQPEIAAAACLQGEVQPARMQETGVGEEPAGIEKGGVGSVLGDENDEVADVVVEDGRGEPKAAGQHLLADDLERPDRFRPQLHRLRRVVVALVFVGAAEGGPEERLDRRGAGGGPDERGARAQPIDGGCRS